jgi:hypothetical protein
LFISDQIVGITDRNIITGMVGGGGFYLSIIRTIDSAAHAKIFRPQMFCESNPAQQSPSM